MLLLWLLKSKLSCVLTEIKLILKKSNILLVAAGQEENMQKLPFMARRAITFRLL